MGLPAVKHEARASRSPRPRLRLVPPASRGPVRRKSCSTAAAQAQQTYRMFASVLIVVALLGVGRVWLSVQAAEASIDSSRLRADIKSQRYEGDMLEVRQSALGSPSRIRAIAGAAFDMAPASKVTYLDLSAPDAAAKPRPARTSSLSGLEGVVAAAMDLAAGEAQVLLVGDVGLASTR